MPHAALSLPLRGARQAGAHEHPLRPRDCVTFQHIGHPLSRFTPSACARRRAHAARRACAPSRQNARALWKVSGSNALRPVLLSAKCPHARKECAGANGMIPLTPAHTFRASLRASLRRSFSFSAIALSPSTLMEARWNALLRPPLWFSPHMSANLPSLMFSFREDLLGGLPPGPFVRNERRCVSPPSRTPSKSATT